MVGMVAYTDYILAPIAIRLSNNGPITCQKLSEESGIPHSTVKQSLKRMIDNDVLNRHGKGRKWGYIYFRGEHFEDIGS